MKFIIDSNTLISLINVGKHKEFINFFNKNDYEVIVPSFIINELRAGRPRLFIEQNTVQTEYAFTDPDVESMKIECKRVIGKALHTNHNDTDYKFILAAIEEQADNVITNDYDIQRYLQKFRYSVKGLPKRPRIFSTANILYFILGVDKSIFSLGEFAESNLSIFKIDQLKNWASMLKHHKHFASVGEMNFWLEDIRNSFDPYKDNVVNAIKSAGGTNGN